MRRLRTLEAENPEIRVTGRLHSGECFCAQGVLGQVLVERELAKWIPPEGSGNTFMLARSYSDDDTLRAKKERAMSHLPPWAWSLLGVPDEVWFSLHDKVWRMNDDLHRPQNEYLFVYSWAEIADAIEAAVAKVPPTTNKPEF